jgi:SAM-dependent methyltransferase
MNKLLRKVNLCTNELLLGYLKWNSKHETWVRELTTCQEEIAFLDPNPHYLKSYRQEELRYWFHIPQWIAEDNEKHRIKRCLDIGAAYGTLALFCNRISGCEVYCTDFVETFMSRLLAERYHFSFLLNNIELDPLPWNLQFDAIILTEVLEHLNFYPVPTLRKIRDLLSDDGKLYLSTPDAAQWGKLTRYTNLGEIPYPRKGTSIIDDHVYQYSRNELYIVLDEAGFRIERFKYSPGVVGRHFNLSVIKQ